jgi:cation diffusion facilitator CzcD-associated flavoprotein CzcO
MMRRGAAGLNGTSRPDSRDAVDVEVLVIGAGVTGLYQLQRALEAGFSVKLLEAGAGVGGTWYWNRYPGARFDSESYTYGYIFSRELFNSWEWREHFARQEETERYFNHVADRCDLRRHIRFSTRVVSARFDDASSTWLVRADDGFEIRSRYLVGATGVLSVPFYPNVPGRDHFRGEAYHTGLWPKTAVNFRGKRVAVIGTGSSGVQIIPIIAEDAASLTVYQRTPNWCTPLNNRPIAPEEQAALKSGFEDMREVLNQSASGFLHVAPNRKTFDDSKAERRAFYATIWNSPGFMKLTANYSDVLFDEAANAEWCEFMEEKIRGLVDDPRTAEKLIPRDHGYGGKRPPFVTDYFQVYNRPKVSLIDLRETPIVCVTETGIETSEEARDFDIIVWATGFDFGTGALLRMGIHGRDGLSLNDHWADGPLTFLGLMCHGFPNLLFPGGPHGAAGNNPRYSGDQTDFIAHLLEFARAEGCTRIEVPPTAEQAWHELMTAYAGYSPFNEDSYFFGANLPGKPRRLLLNPAGRPKMLEMMNEVVERNYAEFFPLTGDSDVAGRHDRQAAPALAKERV